MVAIEAIGGFEAVVASSLAAAGLPVVVVNPARVRAFAQALGKRAKTDPIDAAVIAHFAETTKPKLRHMPDEMTRYLAGLVARRRQIVEMIAAEGQRARRMSDKRLIKSIATTRSSKASATNLSPPESQTVGVHGQSPSSAPEDRDRRGAWTRIELSCGSSRWLYTAAVRSSRRPPSDERQLSAQQRASPLLCQ